MSGLLNGDAGAGSAAAGPSSPPPTTLISGRSKRANAGSRMRALLDEQRALLEDEEQGSAARKRQRREQKAGDDDDDGHGQIFIEEEDDGEFQAPAEEADVFDSDFADSESDGQGDDEEAGERVLEKQEEERKKAARRAARVAPSIPTRKPKPQPQQQALLESNGAGPSSRSRRRAIPTHLDPDVSLSSSRRVSSRKATVQSAEVTRSRLQEAADARRRARQQQEEQEAQRTQRKTPTLNQAELIELALEREEENRQSLREWLQGEEERKKNELNRESRAKPTQWLRWRSVGVAVKPVIEEVGKRGDDGEGKQQNNAAPGDDGNGDQQNATAPGADDTATAVGEDTTMAVGEDTTMAVGDYSVAAGDESMQVGNDSVQVATPAAANTDAQGEDQVQPRDGTTAQAEADAEADADAAAINANANTIAIRTDPTDSDARPAAMGADEKPAAIDVDTNPEAINADAKPIATDIVSSSQPKPVEHDASSAPSLRPGSDSITTPPPPPAVSMARLPMSPSPAAQPTNVTLDPVLAARKEAAAAALASSSNRTRPSEELDDAGRAPLEARTYLSLHDVTRTTDLAWDEERTLLFGDHTDWSKVSVLGSNGSRPFIQPSEAPRPEYPRASLCAITGQLARYRDAKTGIPFADVHAARVIRGFWAEWQEERRKRRRKGGADGVPQIRTSDDDGKQEPHPHPRYEWVEVDLGPESQVRKAGMGKGPRGGAAKKPGRKSKKEREAEQQQKQAAEAEKEEKKEAADGEGGADGNEPAAPAAAPLPAPPAKPAAPSTPTPEEPHIKTGYWVRLQDRPVVADEEAAAAAESAVPAAASTATSAAAPRRKGRASRTPATAAATATTTARSTPLSSSSSSLELERRAKEEAEMPEDLRALGVAAGDEKALMARAMALPTGSTRSGRKRGGPAA